MFPRVEAKTRNIGAKLRMSARAADCLVEFGGLSPTGSGGGFFRENCAANGARIFSVFGLRIGRFFASRVFENRLESRTCGGRFCAVLEFERLSGLDSENRPFRGILRFFKSFIKRLIKIKIKSC